MEDQNVKICSNCSTVNSSDFTYCKNCGTQLYSNNQESQYTNFANDYHSMNYNHNAFYEKDGINAETMAAFVGKNSDIYLSKFMTMKINNKKASWHWPVFLLGALLGPVGVAFWFFYRKMYKLAFLFLALGALLLGVEAWSSFIYPLGVVLETYGANIFLTDTVDQSTIMAVGETFMNSVHPLNTVVSLLSLAVYILCPMFAFRLYENFAAKRIKSLSLHFDDPKASRFYISHAGGTSVLAVVLSVILYYLVAFIGMFILIFITILNFSQGVL